jgi:Na+-translocating ferredoxin:NAD+ oxidoreductase RnfD subunit
MSLEPESLESVKPPRANRTLLPGIFLIVVGALNMAAAIPAVAVGIRFMTMPVEELERVMKEDPNVQRQMAELKKQGTNLTANDFRNIYIYGGNGLGIVWAILGLVIIAGGICLCVRKAYALALIASILAAIPCLSAPACCGLGEGIGIWALVVLLNAEVKALFHATPPPLP